MGALPPLQVTMAPELEAALADKLDALKAAQTEANQLLKDLRAERKLCGEQRAALAALLAECVEAVAYGADKIVSDSVAAKLETLEPTLREFTDRAHAHIRSEFEALANLYMHGNPAGTGESLHAVAVRNRDYWLKRGIPHD